MNNTNDNPTITINSTLTANEDDNQTLAFSYTDIDGDTVTATQKTAPLHGTILIDATDITYTPTANYNGSDSFTITLTDGNGYTTDKTINVTVNNTNDNPTITINSNIDISENSGYITTVNATDIDEDELSYSLSGKDKDKFTINSSTGKLEFLETPNYGKPTDYDKDNIYEVDVVVIDSKQGVASEAVSIKILDIPLDDVSSLNSFYSPYLFNNSTVDISIYDDDLQKTVALSSDIYTHKVLDGGVSIDDGKIVADTVNGSLAYGYFKPIVLFEFEGLKHLKEFTLIKMDENPSDSIPFASYKNNPFELKLNNSYSDSLSDANIFEDQTRWFSLNVKNDGIYKLIYVLNTNKGNNIYPSNPGNITYKLYYKGNDGSLQLIGSKPFDPVNTFILDLQLEADKEYFLELKTSDDLWTVEYIITLLSDATQEQDSLYNQYLTLDDTGNFNQDIILPLFDTYELSVVSDNEIDVNFHKYSDKNIANYAIIKTFKEGKYTLDIKGKPEQKVYYTVKKVTQKQELEDNENYKYANIYNANTKATIKDTDIDTFAFVSTGDILTLNIELLSTFVGDEVFKIELLNAAGALVASKTKFASSSYFDVNFIGFPIKENNYYIIRIRTTSMKPIEYSFTINGSKRILSKSEEAYSNLYNEHKASGKILDENLNIIEGSVTQFDVGDLIILTGDSDNPTDSLYVANQKLSSTFYNRFTQRGLSDEDIYWLNYNSIVDIDNDGGNDDVVDSSDFGKAKFYDTITTWAKDTNKNGPLYIYMVDHGANGSFLLSYKDKDNDGIKEIVYASELVSAVNSFIAATSRDVYIIIEACKSGSFIPAVQNSEYSQKIAIITSSEAGEFSYIDKFGTVSFTKFMVDEILSGKTINKAYTDALTKLNSLGGVYKKQVALIYANTDALKNNIVGGSFGVTGISLTSIDNLYIDGIEDNVNIDVESKKNITLNAKVTADSGISKVWSTIIPPDFTTALDDNFTTPNLAPYTKELNYNASTKQFETTWDIFSPKSYNGEYKITVYAEDTDGLVYSKSITANGIGELDYTETVIEPEPDNNTTEPTPITKVLAVSNGWNLVSLPVDTNLSQSDISTKFPHAKIIWKYKDSVWSAYSPNSSVQDALAAKSINPIDSLSKAEGFWISNDGMEQVSFNGIPYDITTDSKLTSTTKGWKLLGTGTNINVNDLESVNNNIHIIWSYTNNTWNAYSTDTDVQSVIETLTSINTLESIDAGSGFWVNVNE